MSDLGPLRDGARVAIVGGGPGGVGCALALHHLGARQGRRFEITIVDAKRFERHHNLCVGVLSDPLPALAADCLGVPFPHHLSRGGVAGYVLHTAREQITLKDEQRASLIIRRAQYDDYMLNAARGRGIRIEEARAVDVDFHSDGLMVYTESAPIEADVVVGAFGMDEGSAAMFERATRYRPPKWLVSMLTRYDPGPAVMAGFRGFVHAFLPKSMEIEFGAITPKAGYVAINIAGLKVDAHTMQIFLNHPEVQAVLPSLAEPGFDIEHLPVYKGRFPCSLARHYYGDRYVMVGDAAGLVRAFKGKGVTSAVQTGIRAAETMLTTGIGREAFATTYEKANRDITGDALYGSAVRLLVGFSARRGFIDPVIRAARHDPGVRHALFGAVSAHDSYRHILTDMLNYHSVLAVTRAVLPGG